MLTVAKSATHFSVAHGARTMIQVERPSSAQCACAWQQTGSAAMPGGAMVAVGCTTLQLCHISYLSLFLAPREF
eukprot:361947-Chlamydomonas_euryale.AAC.17